MDIDCQMGDLNLHQIGKISPLSNSRCSFDPVEPRCMKPSSACRWICSIKPGRASVKFSEATRIGNEASPSCFQRREYRESAQSSHDSWVYLRPGAADALKPPSMSHESISNEWCVELVILSAGLLVAPARRIMECSRSPEGCQELGYDIGRDVGVFLC